MGLRQACAGPNGSKRIELTGLREETCGTVEGTTRATPPCVREVAAWVESGIQGAQISESGSIRPGIQGPDSGAAVAAGELSGTDISFGGGSMQTSGVCSGYGRFRLTGRGAGQSHIRQRKLITVMAGLDPTIGAASVG